VLVWRPPLAVARSLHHRNGIPMADGLALWDHYNRSALEGLVGIETLVVEYEPVVDDPQQFVSSLAEWLTALDEFEAPRGGWRLDAALSMISAELRHQDDVPHVEEDRLVLLEQRELADHLTRLQGPHHPLHASFRVGESPWARELLDRRRAAWSLRSQLDASRTRQGEMDEKMALSAELLAEERRRLRKAGLELEACHRELARLSMMVE